MKLSPQAKSALEVLHEKHLNYTIARATIESELKKELQIRLAGAKQERDRALRIAADSGVPKTQLGKAIGTSNYRTVQEILAKTEGLDLSRKTNTTYGVLVQANPEGGYLVSLNNVGDNNVSGNAVLQLNGDELEFVSGDAFVLPQLYRNELVHYVIEKAREM
jgi:hypothetical protein